MRVVKRGLCRPPALVEAQRAQTIGAEARGIHSRQFAQHVAGKLSDLSSQ